MSTDFTGVTFAKQKVTPADDAIVRRAILPDGILTGCALSYSGSTLTMAAGQLMVCGRQIKHPSAQNWAVSDATSGYARLLLTIDLTRTASKETFDQVVDTIEYATSADGFSELEQADINSAGTKYQIAVCVVSLGTGGITGIVEEIEKSEASAGKLFAVIGVTYPAGSTCTCTNGSKTLTAKDTSGKAIFVIPSAGTWTVKAAKGSQSKSVAVKITTEGQVETVALSFALDVYNAGTFGTDSSGTKFSAGVRANYNSITQNQNSLDWWCDANTNNLLYISPSINPSGYSTLKMEITAANMNGAGQFGLASGNTQDTSDYMAKTSFDSFSGAKTLSVDISKVMSAKYYIKLTQKGNDGADTTATIARIWLE